MEPCFHRSISDLKSSKLSKTLRAEEFVPQVAVEPLNIHVLQERSRLDDYARTRQPYCGGACCAHPQPLDPASLGSDVWATHAFGGLRLSKAVEAAARGGHRWWRLAAPVRTIAMRLLPDVCHGAGTAKRRLQNVGQSRTGQGQRMQFPVQRPEPAAGLGDVPLLSADAVVSGHRLRHGFFAHQPSQ